MYGFDVVFLWHVFEEKVSDVVKERGKSLSEYVGSVGRVIEGLGLPMGYLATDMTVRDDKLEFTLYLDYGRQKAGPYDVSSLCYTIREVCYSVIDRNPLLRTEEHRKYRAILKNRIKCTDGVRGVVWGETKDGY